MNKIQAQDYNIYFSNKEALRQFCLRDNYSSVFVIVDEHTEADCLPKLMDCFPEHFTIIRTPFEEKNKTLVTCQLVWDKMVAAGADRHSLCVNLGGGVIGDLGGFAASTFMRGMDFIQIPTSLLAMVDASVGGKFGVDYKAYKNYIGLFTNPQGVFIFPDLLASLDKDQLRSGYAEMIKHALIADNQLWLDLVAYQDWEKLDWADMIYQSVSIKQNIVSQDPLEKGMRKILNFGHTLGHAIESLHLMSDAPMLHGDAVGLGMICESYLSLKRNLTSAEEYASIRNYLLSLYGQVERIHLDSDKIYKLCLGDKKNKDGKILCTLLTGIGSANYNYELSKAEIFDALLVFNN